MAKVEVRNIPTDRLE